MLNLTAKDTTVIEAALALLQRVIPQDAGRDLSTLHDEALVPRVAHVLLAMNSGSLKPTPSIAALCFQIVYSVIRDDGMCFVFSGVLGANARLLFSHAFLFEE